MYFFTNDLYGGQTEQSSVNIVCSTMSIVRTYVPAHCQNSIPTSTIGIGSLDDCTFDQ